MARELRGGKEQIADLLADPLAHRLSRRLRLHRLVDRIGHKTLLFASDFPHESNIEHAMHDMEELLEREDLSEEAKQGIFCDNTLAYYGGR